MDYVEKYRKMHPSVETLAQRVRDLLLDIARTSLVDVHVI
jgi:hypothetical protein